MSTIRVDDRGIVVRCPACGRKNRIPYSRLKDTGRCPDCRATITPPAVPVEVDREAHFDALIRSASVPVVVDFWAPWCGPCHMIAPELEKVAARGQGTFVVAKVNTETLPGLAQRMQIRSIPTLAVFKSGREVARSTGARPGPAIESFIQAAVGADVSAGR